MSGKLVAAVAVALSALACGGINSPSSNRVETFNNTVQPASFGPAHQFTIGGNGEILVTVTSITPGNVFLGVIYGQFAGGNNCSPIQQTAVGNTAIGRTAITGQAFVKGEYCVQLFDAAAAQGLAPLAVAQNYTVTVSHP